MSERADPVARSIRLRLRLARYQILPTQEPGWFARRNHSVRAASRRRRRRRRVFSSQIINHLLAQTNSNGSTAAQQTSEGSIFSGGGGWIKNQSLI